MISNCEGFSVACVGVSKRICRKLLTERIEATENKVAIHIRAMNKTMLHVYGFKLFFVNVLYFLFAINTYVIRWCDLTHSLFCLLVNIKRCNKLCNGLLIYFGICTSQGFESFVWIRIIHTS